MAEGNDDDKDSKTEEPSQKKLEEAIEKGQVVNSKEVTSFFLFLFLTFNIIWIVPPSFMALTTKLKYFLNNAGVVQLDEGIFKILMISIISKTLIYMSPLFLTMIIVVIFSSYLQYGAFIFSAESLKPKLSKLSPMAGFKRIFSMKSFLEFLKGIFKIGLVGAFVYLIILADIRELTQYQELSLIGIISHMNIITYHILALVTLIVAAIALIDFSYQKYEHHNKLKMTKQEVKDEYKQMEGNPEIKQKLRALRREQSQRRIRQTVPEATVIITNPEHYAIALKYEAKGNRAPICIAKGLDLIALKIKEIAEENKIPIVESPPLARALYKDVKIDEEIPVEHFEAVAKIISYVFSLDKKQKK